MMNGPWQAFERAIARLLVHEGWGDVDLVGGVGDKGADIIAGIGEKEIVFQAKFSTTNRPLSVDIVGDVVRAMDFYEIRRGICVSNRYLGPKQKEKMKTYIKRGYEITSVTSGNLLKEFEKLPKWTNDERKLYPYQANAVNELKGVYEAGTRRSLIAFATGMGKTFVAGSFLKWLYKNDEMLNVLVLAHTKPLIEQFDRSIWKCLPKTVSTHLLYQNEKPTYNEGVLLSTFQSFQKFYEQKEDLLFDLVIVDEAHHAPARTFKRIIERLSPKFLLGLTATPFRMDLKSVVNIFGEPLVKYDVIRGMKTKYLCEVDYRLKNDNIDRDWIGRNSNKGYTIKHLNKKVFIPQRDEEICKIILDYWKQHKRGQGIVFCNSVKHADRIEKIFLSRFNFSARCLTTTISNEEVTKRLRMFRKGELKILTVYDMLNEGIDVPDVDLIAFLRVTHSRVYFLQQLGRGLRYKANNNLLVLDFVADIRRIGAVRKFYDSFINYDEVKDFEEIKLPEGFKLSFSDEETASFLNLVTRDVAEIEDMDENESILLSSVN